MSQISNENDDDNRSVAASDFVQFDQPDEVPDQQEAQHQQHGQQQLGHYHNPLDWAMNTGGNTSNNCNDLKELKWMMANLQEKFQGSLATLQGKLENLELKAEIRALKEEAAQKANYQALETKFAKILFTQNEKHQKQMEKLESKNRKPEEKLNNLESQPTENGALDGKIEQLKDEFSKMLSDKIVALRKEMDENGKRAIDDNLLKLEHIWGQLMIKSKKLANPKGIVWNGSKTEASISEFGLKATTDNKFSKYVFATEGFAISGKPCRNDNFPFPGTIVFYYEVTKTSDSGWLYSAGVSDINDCDVNYSTNSYAINQNGSNYGYWLSGKYHDFEHPVGAIAAGSVVGSGLLLNPKNKWTVFFTLDGKLLGKPIEINPTVDCLYPTVHIWNTSVVANFGDNPGANPFKFDIDNCPGLVFE